MAELGPASGEKVSRSAVGLRRHCTRWSGEVDDFLCGSRETWRQTDSMTKTQGKDSREVYL